MGNNTNPRIIFRCDYCGDWSSDRPSHYKKKTRHFCSQNCYSEYRKHILPMTEQPAYKNGGMGEKERKHRIKARSDLNHAIRDGLIQRKPCEVCGEIDVHAHHRDYDKPYEVIWLCRDCHWKEHRRIYENPELLND